MLSFTKLLLYKKQNKETFSAELKSRFLKEFFNNPQHGWIRSDKLVVKHFLNLFNQFSNEVFNKFLTSPVQILKTNAKFSCALSQKKQSNTIIVFPDLIKLLYSGQGVLAIAIIAHEMGHIYYDHSQKNIDVITAQLEADEFCKMCNYSDELIRVLQDFPDGEEKARRLHALTSERALTS